jgi:hypothetical protein
MDQHLNLTLAILLTLWLVYSCDDVGALSWERSLLQMVGGYLPLS